MPKTAQQFTLKDALSTLASGLRTSATRPNIYGYKPHDKQQVFHKSMARGKQFIGGNRSGKTVGGATEAVYWLTGKHPYRVTPRTPIRMRGVTVDIEDGINKIMLPEIARWMPKSELVNGSWEDSYSKQSRTLTLENGSFIEFLTYEQEVEKHAGTSRHAIWFDEEPPKEHFIENLLRLTDTGGSWWMTMTPVEGMTWTYDDIFVASKTNPNILVIVVDMDDNPYLNQGDKDIVLSHLSDDEKKARKQGRYVQLGGTIYKMFSPRNIVNPLIPPKEWLHFEMMDHGFANPTCWLWGAVNREGKIIIYEEHYKSEELVEFHARAVHEKRRAMGIVPAYSVGDPSIRNTDPITGTSVHLEYIEHGIPIILGNNDVDAGIQRVGRYILGIKAGEEYYPQLFITRNCENLLYELPRYRRGIWANKKLQRDRNKKEEPHKKDDHACDALRYGVASRPQVDDGTHIPEKPDSMGVPSAVSAYSRIDEGLAVVSASGELDYHLGDEY